MSLFTVEHTMENALKVKKKKKKKTFKITFPLAQLPQKFCFEMIMISIQEIVVLFVDYTRSTMFHPL
jgi:hypothetical protein